ncbi:mannose/fructose/sorbose PTS transporter subunit IIB [Enterococcus caccae]|uniref:PTS system, mannose/fructose/sorbose family, IIB component n=1 Tax=Enterococcus caccae ATCC BAA-1240 TaxID=1158612 RepID=R3UB68_9ENTE|nr:mannose/fructose/sorbose PTS transporter subunit IIB [Enterococcus caccae]EOL50658.1 PTS system, mannose/fructose/sorbose family, IIB component [Enterococcus caccae ATCC BAA-1240]EOT59449.1 PTS system IIB component [Enterococcus caccae ATCC BAA-1240]OJG27643.1 PTS system, mannose/fructose/sorbose family, IIB component [Enterococcus caccae]
MMDIRLVRIDDRLIHGQVATVWTKSTNVNRILVISDAVAHDTLRKALLVQAAPPGVKVNVITVDKMIEAFADERFDSLKVMLLFTNPEDVKRVVAGDVVFKSVNIGGMSFTSGKRMITNAVAVNEEDIAAFKYLHDQGIKLEIRKVVADSQVDLMELLKKEHLV